MGHIGGIVQFTQSVDTLNPVSYVVYSMQCLCGKVLSYRYQDVQVKFAGCITVSISYFITIWIKKKAK